MALLPPSLYAALEAEIGALGAFRELLEAEQQALVSGQLVKLADYARQKTLLAHSLEQQGAERRRQFACNHVRLRAENLHEIDTAEPLPAEARGELDALWRRLQQDARLASRMNQINGRLIEARRQHSQQLMAMIQAHSASAPHTVLSYDARGQTRISAHRNSLGTA